MSNFTSVELDQLTGHDLLKAVNFSDTVTDFDNCADFGHGHAAVKIFNLLTDNLTNLICSNIVCHVISKC